MTSPEHIRISPEEKNFGNKNLLSSQLQLLKLAQSLHKYRILREEELILKITLKNYIEETSKEILKLEKILPKLPHKEESDQKENKEEKNKKLSLEEEIARVRAKLSKLQEEI